MADNVRQGQAQVDKADLSASLVTLDVVSSRFIIAGLPRSMRTLQRYCANGTLDCVKEATETGDTYFVVEQSIGPAITALSQLHDAKDKHRHGATDRATTSHDEQINERQIYDDKDGHSPTATDKDAQQYQGRHTPTNHGTTTHVAQLEARLEEKDAEIEFLREELIDRRGQISDMKGIIDGQNQLLETIQTNVAPIFNALAATVKSNGLGLEADRTVAQGSIHDVTDAKQQTSTEGERDVHPSTSQQREEQD